MDCQPSNIISYFLNLVDYLRIYLNIELRWMGNSLLVLLVWCWVKIKKEKKKLTLSQMYNQGGGWGLGGRSVIQVWRCFGRKINWMARISATSLATISKEALLCQNAHQIWRQCIICLVYFTVLCVCVLVQWRQCWWIMTGNRGWVLSSWTS